MSAGKPIAYNYRAAEDKIKALQEENERQKKRLVKVISDLKNERGCDSCANEECFDNCQELICSDCSMNCPCRGCSHRLFWEWRGEERKEQDNG